MGGSLSRLLAPLWPASVVVDDLDIGRTFLRPAEDDPPLVVDPDRITPGESAAQDLEPVARRHAKIVEARRAVQLHQPAMGRVNQIGREALRSHAAGMDLVGPFAAVAPDRHSAYPWLTTMVFEAENS